MDFEEEKRRYDRVCKEVLSEKDIAANVLQTCAEEFTACPISIISGECILGTPELGSTLVRPDGEVTRLTSQNLEDKTEEDGAVFYDIRFHAVTPGQKEKVGLIINFEAQNKWNPGYPLLKRAGYYLARLVSGQYGTIFTKSHYEKIRKVYSIWICTSPAKEWEYTITRYHMTEENIVGSAHAQKGHYDLMTCVLVCLGNKKYTELQGLLRLLNLVLLDNIGTRTTLKTLQDEFHVKMTPRLEKGVAELCNLSDGLVQRGEARGISIGEARGISIGEARGKVNGISIGEEKNKVATALRLIAEGGFSADFIARISDLPVEKVLELMRGNHLSPEP